LAQGDKYLGALSCRLEFAISDQMLAGIMRTASILFFIFWTAACSAWGQAVSTTDDVRKGKHLAFLLCTACHIVAPDQPYEPTLDPPAPSFESIAGRRDVNVESLKHFLVATHQGLDNPKGMPNPGLADFQAKAIVAYLLSLRK
jgi:mono/diheme cytochrome c family protein